MIKIFLLYFTISLVTSLDLTSLNNLITNVQESPLVNLLLVYDSAKMGQSIEPYTDQIQKNRQGYFKINVIDCASLDQEIVESFSFCTQQYRPHLPLLTFTSPDLNLIDPQTGEKRETKQVPYQGSLEEKKLFQFALPLMKTYSFNLKTTDDLNKFNKDNAQIQRIIYFTDKQTINPYYKALTANFRYTIAFAHVFKNSSLCQIFKIDKFPSLLLNGKEKLNIKSNIVEQIQYLKQYQALQPATIIIPQPVKIAQNFITSQTIQQKIYKNPKYILLHLEDGKPHPQWKNVQSKFQKSFDYYTSGKEIAKQLGIKSLPSIVFFPKSLVKKEILRANFNEKTNFQQIKHQISNLVEDYSLTISNEIEMQKITGMSLREKKFVAILFHHEQISLSYKILSNLEQYKQIIVFHRFKNPEPEVMEQFQIKKIPSILFMFMDETSDQETKEKKEVEEGKENIKLRIAQYPGKFQYNDMKAFFDTLVPKPKSIKEQYTSNSRSLVQLKNNNDFQKSCIEQSCYLLLLNNSPQNSDSASNILKFGEILTKRTNENVGWVDAVCHSQLLQKIQVQEDQLPVLLYFNAKLRRYGKLIGRLSEQTINTFVTKVKNNKIQYKHSYNVQINNKNCVQQHKRLSELRKKSGESTLSEMEKQILQQIKQQQLKKKKQAELQAKKAQKSKKKKKKQKKKVESSDDDL